MTKTPFIKLYKPKNPLTLKRVSKPIKIRLLNDVAVTEDSTGERISLDLLKIDDISSSESTTPEASRPPKPLELPASRPPKPPELPAPGPFKPSEPKNRPLEPVLKSFEELIKPVDSSDPDEIQLNLVTSLCY